MKQYLRLMLGKKSVHAQQCYEGNFVGADFDIHEDLTNNLPEKWRKDPGIEFICYYRDPNQEHKNIFKVENADKFVEMSYTFQENRIPFQQTRFELLVGSKGGHDIFAS